MTMDITTIGIAVDSSPVDTAGAALDRMVAAGDRATAATARLTKASADSARSMAGSLAPAAAKGALAFKSLAEAQAALGPAAAAQLAAAGAFGTVATHANSAKVAVQGLNAATASATARASLDTMAGDAARAKTAMVDLTNASTSLGAASVERVNTALSATNVAALEAARSMIALREATGRATQLAGPLAAASTTAGAGGQTRAPVAVGDAAAINALTSASTRAEAQAAALARTLARDVAASAGSARTAITDLSSATTSLGASGFVDFDRITTSLGATAAKASEAAREVHQLRVEAAQLGALAGATTSLGARVGPQAPAANLREAIERRGMPTLDPRLAGGAAAATALAGAAGKATGQMDALGKSTKLAAWQTQQLGFQVHDFFVQIASGGSPMTALVQQGSQLSGTFGGAGNAVRAITSLITPMRLAMGGAAAAVAALGYAFLEGSRQSRQFADAIVLSGNYAGQTEGQFNAMARGIAASGQVSVSAAREFGQALVATGQVGPQVFERATEAAARYGEATGQTAEEVAKDFASMGRDAVRWAIEHNRSMNFLKAGQIDQIQAFQEAGRAADAQGVIYDALNTRLRQLEPNLGLIDRALRGTKNAWKDFWDAAFDIGRTETIDDKIRNTARAIEGQRSVIGNGPTLQRLLDQQQQNYQEKDKQAGAAIREAAEAEKQQAGIAAKSVIDSYLRRAKAASAYKEELGKLQKSFRDREAAGVPVSAADKAAALAQLKKDFAGAKARSNTEPDQIRREELANRLDAISVAAQRERDTFAFTHRFLQGEFQAGNQSLREYWDARRQVIADGVAAEVAELQKKKDAIGADLDAPGRVKDPSERLKLKGDLDKLTAQQEDARVKGAREATLANQEESASFRQLADQVANYRANLLQLQGDEAGAARVRADHAIEQARLLARQSQGRAGAITPQEQEAERTAVQQVLALNQAKLATSVVNQRLQIEEDRIALAVQRGAISEIDAMGQLGAARSRAVAELEKVVAAQEAVAASRPKDYQLQIDTSRARLELERLKAELDPLKDKFDNLFKDAGADALEGLMTGKKKPLAALKDFVGSIHASISRDAARELSGQIFGKDGLFGGAGGFLAGIFGGKRPGSVPANAPGGGITGGMTFDANKPQLDTSAITTSLSTMQAAGVDPATAALARLQVATDAATNAMGAVASPVLPRAVTGVPLPPVGGTTGDFARFDRQAGAASGIVQGEWDWMRRSSKGVADANEAAATAAMQLAQAASRGGGALSLLPQIVQMIIAAASTSGRAGGGISGLFNSLLGSSGQAAFSQTALGSSGFGTGLAYGNMDIGLFLHRGGIVGASGDRRPIPRGVFADAGRYHGGGTVGGAGTAGLKAHEVPAILMGGPRGKREEVLTASDPRHRDNLSPRAAAALRIPRYHSGGIAGQRPDVLLPAQGVRYLTGAGAGETDKDGTAARAGDVYHLNVTVPMPQGGSRSTAMQYGHAAGKQIQRALVHNGR